MTGSFKARTPGFYQLKLQDRLARLAEITSLSPDDLADLSGQGGLDAGQADLMVENVIGVHALPLGLGLNFLINGREVLVPMAVEEPSVIAGASFMAKLARAGGGFRAYTTPPEMIAQIQVLDIPHPETARLAILESKQSLLDEIAEIDPVLTRLGGGPRDIQVRLIQNSPIGAFLVVHLIIDVRDAMKPMRSTRLPKNYSAH